MSIQWQPHTHGTVSACGRFEIDSVAGGWQAVRSEGGFTATSPTFGSIEEAQAWCEMFVRTPADDVEIDDCQPDFVVIEGVDGVREVIRKSDAPEF